MFKIIKINVKKRGIFRTSPCGCDVALRAKWHRHVDRRDGLHGSRMKRVHVLLLYSVFNNGYSTYKHSIEEFKLTV